MPISPFEVSFVLATTVKFGGCLIADVIAGASSPIENAYRTSQRNVRGQPKGMLVTDWLSSNSVH